MDTLPALYPQGWNKFTVEIPLEPSQQISDMAWTKIRPQFVSNWNSDLGSRINAILLAYSFTPKAHEKTLTTLGINLKDYGIAFDSMAGAVDGNYQGQSILARFDSEEFWTSAKLENWLLACYGTLCHGVWHTPIPPLERAQLMDYALYILPCNLATYTCSLVRRPPGHEFRGFDVLGQLDTPVPDFLGALQRYSQDIHDLVGVVRQSVRVLVS
ncbi:hypothetical protein DFH08DRAFT_891257 [Mycena albidolilacea]|uniref:Uncharacterized protein n=1 Tax=Mycena albidolilacea TaxID=1033008 RepID=A0AAD7EF47_9AGAR|nr:hypothetical protein DFH08DRAFT_891257 [Mycena albidolilacea]